MGMTHIGCGIWLVLLLGMPVFGVLTSLSHRRNPLAGAGCGAVAWLALFAGYLCVLSVIDWCKGRTADDREGVPKWFIPTAWVVFIAAATGLAWMIAYRYSATTRG